MSVQSAPFPRRDNACVGAAYSNTARPQMDKENLFTEPRVEEAASFAVRSPQCPHKKRREPKFPPVNSIRSGGYFA